MAAERAKSAKLQAAIHLRTRSKSDSASWNGTLDGMAPRASTATKAIDDDFDQRLFETEKASLWMGRISGASSARIPAASPVQSRLTLDDATQLVELRPVLDDLNLPCRVFKREATDATA